MFRFRKTSANIQDDKQGISVTLDELLCLRFTSQRLNWFTPHTAQSLQAGNKLSHARGRGMEFSEVRGYQPGDDIRLINWQMTARTGKPYTKVYQEERERPVYLIVQLVASFLNFILYFSHSIFKFLWVNPWRVSNV